MCIFVLHVAPFDLIKKPLITGYSKRFKLATGGKKEGLHNVRELINIVVIFSYDLLFLNSTFFIPRDKTQIRGPYAKIKYVKRQII